MYYYLELDLKDSYRSFWNLEFMLRFYFVKDILKCWKEKWSFKWFLVSELCDIELLNGTIVKQKH